MDGIQIAVSGICLVCSVSSIILLNVWFEQKRHNKSAESLLTEIRDQLNAPA